MEHPHKTKIFQSPDMDMPKNQQQQLIIELIVKQLTKPELCSVKTTVLYQYIMKEIMKLKFSPVRKLEILNWNLKQNLNKTKWELSSSSGEVDRIVAAMKLEQGKTFICNMTILPQYYIVFAFTDDCLEGVERYCVNSSSVFRCDKILELMDKRINCG